MSHEMHAQTILVVDDEAAIRSLVTTVLAADGYQVVEASDGDAALRRADDGDDGIDLLLTDVRMPGMDGFVLARSFLKSHPGAKVLFMSGYFEISACACS